MHNLGLFDYVVDGPLWIPDSQAACGLQQQLLHRALVEG